jgi:membrane-bound ClpP family serine protease
MSYELLAILFLVLGCGLIVAEVFIPSGGMILILCVVAFVASIWCAYKAWWGVSTVYFSTYLAVLVLMIPALLIGIYKLLNDTRVGDRILLAAPDPDDVTPYQQEAMRLAQLVGQAGKALTPLMPGGMVSVGGERLHAYTEGLLVSQGSDIEVVGVKGTRVIVRLRGPAAQDERVGSAETRPEEGAARSAEIAKASTPLDFDVPQS